MFYHYAMGKEVVGVSYNLGDLLELFARKDARRPQEIVEVIFDIRTGIASQRTVAITGGALAGSTERRDKHYAGQRYRRIGGKHNKTGR